MLATHWPCTILMVLCLAGCGAEKDHVQQSGSAEIEVKDLAWPSYGGDPTGTQYSSAKQITRKNVGDLTRAWVYHTGELSEGSETMDQTVHQVTPILANERLYLCTPLNNIVALDPQSGTELWRVDPGKAKTGTMYSSHVCRGVAYWESGNPNEKSQSCGKRVFQLAQFGTLMAVDADTGELCQDFADKGRLELNSLDYKGDGVLNATSPPAIFQDVVIVGGTVIDNKWKDSMDGIVRGFDVRTGKELWHFNPIPEHLSAQVGGANTWAPISVDPERGWVFLPTGSPSYDTYGVNRKDPIPFGNAVVVLNALDGEVVWSYQTVHHDLWDYDLASMPTLATVMHEGVQKEAVIQATKTGFVFVLDRLTGEPLFDVVEKPVPASDIAGEFASPTQPIPTLPKPVTSQSVTADDAWGALVFDKRECRNKLSQYRNEGIFTPPSIQGSILHPSFLGGTNWGGVAIDEQTGVAVLNSSNLVARVSLVPRDDYDDNSQEAGVSDYEMNGAPFVMLREVLMSSVGAPCNPPPWGSLTAIDLNNGETLWSVPFGRVDFGGPFDSLPAWGAPNQGGPIVTAGGLIFIGASLDSRFRAYDITSGEELWSTDVPAPATATPMTYVFKGTQYVVVAAGGHGGFQTKLSDAIVAFALESQ